MSEEYQVILNYEGATPVIRLKGEITSEAEDALVGRYEEIPADRRARVILDFQETRYINSSGIAILIQLITRAADARNRIDFSSLSAHFRKVMEIVGLTDFVQIHASLPEALREP